MCYLRKISQGVKSVRNMRKIPETQKMPNKGDIIFLNMNGLRDEEYRVLKVNGNVAEVLGMTNLNLISIKYNGESKTDNFKNGTKGQLYKDSDLDNCLNVTWYNSLTETAKNAIVPKNIIQKMYSWSTDNFDTATYIGTRPFIGGKYCMTLKDFKYVGNRNVYALGVEDVVEYLGNGVDNLNPGNIGEMYWYYKFAPVLSDILGSDGILLNSAYADNFDEIFCINAYFNAIVSHGIRDACKIRPSFQIDLSKIEWKKK